MPKLSDVFLNILGNALQGSQGTPMAMEKRSQAKFEEARNNLATLSSLGQSYNAQPPGFVGPSNQGTINPNDQTLTSLGVQPGTRFEPIQKTELVREPDTKTGEYRNTLVSIPRGSTFREIPKDPFSAASDHSNAEQDRLEQQAIDRIARLRGDQSLARTENQRDASIQAYNTISRIEGEGRLPSQLEYFDLLGQMWKARTGASPTDQSIRDLDAKSFQGDIGKAVQYFTGKPAGRTTADILKNIKGFAKDSGKQADQLHAGYMKAHLIKPTGLSDDRWSRIVTTGHGLNFDEATGSNQPLLGQSLTGNDGWSYVGPVK